MENLLKGDFANLSLSDIIGFVGIIVTTISTIVTTISIIVTTKSETQRSNRPTKDDSCSFIEL